MPSAQLDFADLLLRGAAKLTGEDPSLAAAPAVASRLARVLGARLPCQSVIHWACPVCSTRTVTRWRCGPRCATCRSGAPASANLLRQLPLVPVRHWVLSLPSPQRFDFAGDPRSEAAVVKAFMQAVFARLRARDGDRSAGCGAVAAIHRSGAALNLNLHVHALVVDGVFHRSPDGSRFAGQVPGPEDLAVVAREVYAALARLPATDTRDPALATLQQAARPRSKISRAAQRRAGSTFDLGGLKVFAGPPVEADDRAALRRLCDYVTRPASARLAMAGANPDISGPRITTHPQLGADEIVARLVAATPAEPAISVRTYGVLAPRAAHLWQLCHGHQLELPGMPCAEPRRLARAQSPRCARCDVPLAALAVEDASDPAPRGP